MRFKITDYNVYYKLYANCYSIHIYQSPLSKHDFKNIIVQKIRYHCRKGGFSWLAVYSTTDSKTARSAAVRTGRRGRPKKIIQGKKEDGHIHNIIIGTKERSARSTVHEIKDSLDKKYKRKICQVISKGNDDHAFNFMDYCLRQADIIRTSNDFDFEDAKAKHYYFKNLE